MAWYDGIVVKVLPSLWKKASESMQKQDVITKALQACYKQPMLRKTWTSFTKAVENWLRDGIDEVNLAKHWTDDAPLD